MSERVVIGMSGGVDSSVAAYLLKEKGYEVIGVSMKMLNCHNPETEDAKKVADKLGIEFHILDMWDLFEEKVRKPFVEEYLAGRTPNPCCVCNRCIKWEALYRYALENGANYIATGHYAKVDRLPNGRYAVRNSSSASKDQTYVLYGLSQEHLSHTIMPLGEYTKERIRDIATQIGLTVADKPDSQDICFIPDNDYEKYIREHSSLDHDTSGNFVDDKGNVVGRHKGYFCYTIGQRKGLGIALGKPVFVNHIDSEKNEVRVGDEDIIFTKSLRAGQVNLMGTDHIEAGDRYMAKIRYAHKGDMCRVLSYDGYTLCLEFDRPVRAITPGQSVVLYDGEYVMAGGIIE